MLTRRLVLQTGLASMAAPVLVRTQSSFSGTVTVMSYAGIFQDNYTKAVIEPFQRAHPGVKVNYVPGGTSARRHRRRALHRPDRERGLGLPDVVPRQVADHHPAYNLGGTLNLPISCGNVPLKAGEKLGDISGATKMVLDALKQNG